MWHGNLYLIEMSSLPTTFLYLYYQNEFYKSMVDLFLTFWLIKQPFNNIKCLNPNAKSISNVK